jgi:hypothetical protein
MDHHEVSDVSDGMGGGLRGEWSAARHGKSVQRGGPAVN